MSPSDTLLKDLATRLGRMGERLRLKQPDLELIAETTRALLQAEDTLAAAGLFAQAVGDPPSLRFAWASGQQPFDPEAALKQLSKAAQYIERAVEKQLFGVDQEDASPFALPDIKPFYRVRVGGVQVIVGSPRPLPIDEVCAVALRKLAKAGICIGPVMEVSRCAEHAGPEQTVFVATKDQLVKAGLLAAGRREV